MKGQTFDLSALIAMGNQVVALIPRLMALAYFLCLAVLAVRMVRAVIARQLPPTIELAAIAIAFGVATR